MLQALFVLEISIFLSYFFGYVEKPFHKTNFSISHDQQSEMLQSLIFLCVQVDVYQNILKLRC